MGLLGLGIYGGYRGEAGIYIGFWGGIWDRFSLILALKVLKSSDKPDFSMSGNNAKYPKMAIFCAFVTSDQL